MTNEPIDLDAAERLVNLLKAQASPLAASLVESLIAEVRRLREERGAGWEREDYIEDAFPEGFSGGLRNRPVIVYRGPWTRPTTEETR